MDGWGLLIKIPINATKADEKRVRRQEFCAPQLHRHTKRQDLEPGRLVSGSERHFRIPNEKRWLSESESENESEIARRGGQLRKRRTNSKRKREARELEFGQLDRQLRGLPGT